MKRLSISARLHGATTQKTVIVIFVGLSGPMFKSDLLNLSGSAKDHPRSLLTRRVYVPIAWKILAGKAEDKETACKI
jgi:hypothetical protein